MDDPSDRWKEPWQPSDSGASKRLVVITHGLSTRNFIKDAVIQVRASLPEADIFFYQYDSRLWSQQSAVDLATELNLQVAARFDQHRADGEGYSAVTLIGHSIGALLVRGAYLMATGRKFENTNPEAMNAELDWSRYVDRIILLAGLNNGWTAPDREALGSLGRIKSAIIWGLISYANVRHRAAYMLSVTRGSPFVTDVRLNWIDLQHTCAAGKHPETILLRGSTVDLITAEDIDDFVGGSDFKYRPVPGTNHFEIGVFNDETARSIRDKIRRKKWGETFAFRMLLPKHSVSAPASASGSSMRRNEFISALTDPWHKISSHFVPNLAPNAAVTDVVMIRHGIRDDAQGWVTRFEKKLRSRSRVSGQHIEVDRKSFGRFSMMHFLIPGARMKRVRLFMDDYASRRARFPNAAIHFFGHSYGTYIGCRAIRDYRSCRFGRLALGNSVMCGAWNWANYIGSAKQVGEVVNLKGSRDWIVALFPGSFQGLRELFGIGREHNNYLGSAGFLGFASDLVSEVTLRGGHSAATRDAYHEQISDFLLEGAIPAKSQLARSSAITWAAKCPFLVGWATPLCLILLGAVYIGIPLWGLLGVLALLGIVLHSF